MSKAKLVAAKELLQAKEYDTARAILETIKDNPTAARWLEELDRIAPQKQKRAFTSEIVEYKPRPHPVYIPPDQRKVSYRSGNDMEVVVARNKSYISAAVLTLILYWIFWLPGLIVNVMYLNEASRNQQIGGEKLPGVGCLWLLLILNLLPLLALCGIIST